jgi:hypothetical protein
MMKIRSNDHTYEGTPAEIVAQLNNTSLAHADSHATYMNEAADRATMTTGIDVRYDTPENFLMDLEKAGLIEVLDEKTA